MRWVAVWGAVIGWAALAPVPAAADDISEKIEAARTAYGKGDSLRTLEAIQAAQITLAAKLIDQFTRTLPPPLAGWEATAPDSEPLDSIGGGLTVTRGYLKGEAALNASLVVDNPSVANTLALFHPGAGAPQATGPGTWQSVKVGSEDALLRYDAASKQGEIVLAVQNRAALQIEGSEIASSQVLTDLAQGWNIALLKKLLGP